MGMIGHLRRLTAAEQAEIERNPAATRTLTGKASAKKKMPAIMAALPEAQRVGLELATRGGDREAARQKILEVLANAGVSMPMMGKQRDGSLRLEKSWHVLHCVLSGSAGPGKSPLSQALLGGREVGNDVGYGPARVPAPLAVQEIATALASVDIKPRAASYDVDQAKSRKIYCAEHDEAEESSTGQIKAYYDEAAKSGEAMLLWID
jgi:hypothetical protein